MPSILLHICCGPCSIMPVKYLQDNGFQIYGFFSNPNIHPLSEYLRRREGALECAEKLGINIIFNDSSWNLAGWLKRQLPKAGDLNRCIWCCQSRLESAYRKAMEINADYFSTTLLYSRYQPHDAISEYGRMIAKKEGPDFFYKDFRKDWQNGVDISKEWGIYRQPYCGCVFSENERYAKKLLRLQKN